MAKIQSVEPNIADLANGWMRSYKLDYKLEQESLNTEIDRALDEYFSKNGGVGGNRPDAKLLLQDKNMVNYPVLIEYKGYKDKLVALDSEGKVANKTAKNQPDFKRINIFPKDYCVGQHYDKIKWNSIINKTPIAAASNREIGGVAPSAYLKKLEKKGSVSADVLDKYVKSHWINHVLLRQDAFQDFIIDRAKRLLNAIEKATGRTISGKDSDEVIQQFGASLT